mgnify:FL=1|jgi:hypothetical protein
MLSSASQTAQKWPMSYHPPRPIDKTSDKITRLKWLVRVITRVIFYFHKKSIIKKTSVHGSLVFF